MADSPMPRQFRPVRGRPFSLLRGLAIGQVRSCLEGQATGDVATVLSFLPYRLTAAVLEGYEESEQHKIVRQIATMQTPDRTKINQLEQELATRLKGMAAQGN